MIVGGAVIAIVTRVYSARRDCVSPSSRGVGSAACRRRRWRRVFLAAPNPDYAHGEVEGLAHIGGGREDSPKEGAIKERVLVVATRRAHAVGPTGARIKRTARAVADRRDIEPVKLACWQGRQVNVQSGNLDHVFGKTEPAPASRSNYRRCCHAAGDQRAAVPFGDAGANFPGRASYGGVRQIVGED